MLQALRTFARVGVHMAAAAMFSTFAGSALQAQTVPHARLSTPATSLVLRTPLSGAEPLVSRYGTDQGALADSEPLLSMKLVLRRGNTEKAALDNYLEQVQNPSSPSFHKWLTPEEFGQQFGASDEDIAAVTAWLEQQGLVVNSISKSRTVVTFSGTEAQFQSAFQTAMHRYLVNGEVRIANASTPTVPSALAPAIVGLATLGNARFHPTHTQPMHMTRDSSGVWHREADISSKEQGNGAARPQFTESSGSTYYLLLGPSDFATMYDVQPVWAKGFKGAGQSIAIVAESNVVQSDIDSFRKAFGLPATRLNVSVIGPDPGLGTTDGSESEAVLDVEWAGATAPEADINLLVAASTSTDAGIVIAAEYAVDNNISPILNLSWGACELGLQAAGNQFFSDLWSQAAAQGISVVVSSGDAGSVACDQGQYYATYGQQVNGIASPTNAIAVGGTDFPVNAEHLSAYWNKANDPTTLQSVKSYVPESVWNNSCASPDLLLHASDFGLSETTNAQICNQEVDFLNTVGGGGGISLCTSSDGSNQSSCKGGYDAPVWQQSIGGIGPGGKRHLPDVSFFSGSGLWASAYAYCQADASTTSTDCINNNGVMTAPAAGGTSFAAPAFSGILALLNQQQGVRQGNITKYLYGLAARQFADPALSSSCQSADGNNTAGCIFHDIVRGTNAEPCTPGSLVDLTTGSTCVTATSGDYVGIAAGYAATTGYDAATGLGSLDAINLLANWQSVVALDATSVTTHKLTSAASVPYGSVNTADIAVKAASGSTLPTGTVAFLSTESDGSTQATAAAALSSGNASVSFHELLPGTHSLYASYGGDAKFGSSKSSPTSLIITKANTSLSASASSTTVVAPNSVTILVQVQTASLALNPTGTVILTDHTTGKVLGFTSLTASSQPTGASWALASVKLRGTDLNSGENVIDANYAGDGNYLAAVSTSVTVKFTPAYTLSSSSSSLDIDLASTNQVAAAIAITSNNGAKVDPASLSLACQNLSLSGLGCSFTAPSATTSGGASSTLTVNATNPQTAANVEPRPVRSSRTSNTVVLAFLGCGLLWNNRRRRQLHRVLGVVLLLTIPMIGMLSGCAGSPGATTSAAINNTLSVSSVSPTYGDQLVLTSTLTAASNTASPDGTVVFYDGANLLGSTTVSNGRGQFTVSKLAVGKHSITSSYSGNGTFMPSTSSPVSVDVQLATTLNVSVSDTAGNVSLLALPVLVH